MIDCVGHLVWLNLSFYDNKWWCDVRAQHTHLYNLFLLHHRQSSNHATHQNRTPRCTFKIIFTDIGKYSFQEFLLFRDSFLSLVLIGLLRDLSDLGIQLFISKLSLCFTWISLRNLTLKRARIWSEDMEGILLHHRPTMPLTKIEPSGVWSRAFFQIL